MAADKTLEVLVKTNIAQEDTKGEKFNNTLKKIVKTNNELNSSMSATRTGSRAADAALGISEVGMARGTTGAGGRGGERDFARQAQGLGGLVHLYATFAANIYAVSAAFSALQKAADFQRMEQSAARMSVVLGINLNNAAKAMVNLTDGAVSYAEAIEKTNLAASAGLSTDQMSRLTKVAKGASTALGRDMGDSLNRLVKGAVKLEPELLDELGILTKASDAYRVYGAGIGKTEDELTKFEKTQAFVNAVIAEGESKFSSLYDTIEANPYTQLQAKLQDVAKSSLNVINSGLTPIVKILSENPTALVGVISLLITKLVSMAIPSVTQFGDRAAASADKAMNSFNSLNTRFEQYSKAIANVKLQETLFQADAAKKAADRVKNTEAVIAANEKLSGAIAKSNKAMYGKNVLEAMFNKGPVEDVTLAIDKYSRSLQKAEAMNKRIIAGDRYSAQAKTGAAERLSAIADVQSAIKTTQFADEAHKYNNYLKEAEASLQHGLMLETQSAETILTRTQRRKLEAIEVAKLNAGTIKNIALSTEMGAGWKTIFTEFKMGWEDLNSLLIKQSAGTIRTLVEKFKFAGTAIGTAIGGPLMAGLSMAMRGFMVYTIVKDIIGGVVVSILGEAKSLTELNTAVENTQDSHKLLSDRLAEINSLMSSGITDINAYAKAHHALGASINTYSDSLRSLADNYRKVSLEIETGANWTKFTNWLSKGINKDALSTVSEAMARDVMGAIQVAMLKEGNTATIDIANILNINPSDVSNLGILSQRFRELNDQGDRLVQIRLNDYLNKVATESFNTESRISAVNEALKEANKEAEKLRSKREFQDPKYEALANEIEKILKLTNAPEEQFRLIQQAIRGMNPTLIEELGKMDPALKEFFNSDVFKRDHFSALFNMDPAIESVKTGLAQMSSMLQTFTQDQRNFKVSLAGTGEASPDTYQFKSESLKRVQSQELALLADTRARAEAALTDDKLRKLIDQEYPGISDTEKQKIIDSIKATRTQLFDQLALDISKIPQLAGKEFLSTTEGTSALSGLIASSKEKIQQFLASPTGVKDETAKSSMLEAGKKLPGALEKIKTPTQGSKIPTYPKDRLQVEKAYVETLKYELALLENQQSLNDLNLTIAEQRLGLAGEEYNTLLEQQLSQKWSIETQKYTNSLAEANLKKEQAILGVKNDKNTLDKDGSIQDITKEYERQVDLITKSWKITTLKLEDEKYINELKKSQALSDVESARVAMLQAKASVARLGGQFGSAAGSAQGQVAALQAQYSVQQSITATIAERAKTDKNSAAKYLESLTKQLDLAQKIYEAKRAATEEELKAFELAQGTGGIGQYLTNTAKEFGYQIAEALKSAKSATSVLISGVVGGIDSSIKKLFEGIQQGNLDMQELSDFARNALSDAFRDAATQSVQSGWKSLLSNAFPSLNDPLKVAIDQNTQAIQANTASQGGATTGTTSADSALVVAGEKQEDAAKESSNAGKTFLKASDTMFLAGAALMAFQGKWEQVAFMFLAQLATTLTTYAVSGGSSGGGMWGSLFSAVSGMFTASANGNVMSEYGPVKLAKYSRGGVATSPQLSLFGEGSKNEAYVPLPDNRTIPVTLSGNQGSQVSIGDTTINVTVDSGGSAETTVEGNAQMAKMLGQAIKKTVQEELINQSRPGGMFYGR